MMSNLSGGGSSLVLYSDIFRRLAAEPDFAHESTRRHIADLVVPLCTSCRRWLHAWIPPTHRWKVEKLLVHEVGVYFPNLPPGRGNSWETPACRGPTARAWPRAQTSALILPVLHLLATKNGNRFCLRRQYTYRYKSSL